MNRRKMLEVSRRQKILGKRSSIAALHSNPNVIVHPKTESPALEKGIQHGDAESRQIYPEAVETERKHSVPKTKFTSHDKSSEFSPRLKSFPAEELRRFDASPRLETTLAPYELTGDDAITSRQNKIIPQRLLQPQSFQNPPTPDVFNVVPLERSPERQPHRPHVPRPTHYAERVIAEHQSEGNFLKKKEPEELERQPVGGRNAAIFKQQVSGPEKNIQAAVIPEDRLIQKEEHPQHRNHVQFADNPQEIPEQMYLQNYPQQYVQHPQHYLGLGMTSPQDVSINHSRMCQQGIYPHHHQSFGSGQQGRGPWPVGPHLGQQFANSPPAHQVAQQSDQGNMPSIQQSPNVTNYPPAIQQPHQHQQTVQPSQKSPKLLQFPPEMIRDQEKLVQILRQQGFPDEIIKRQFDGLLAEQQRQLLFFHQLENPDTTSGRSKKEEQPRRRRITRLEEDEKPEWMIHITPPWVSQATLEQMARNEEQTRQQAQQDLHEQQENSQPQDFHPHNLQQHVQLVNPVVYQQLQQQQMMIPNAQYPTEYHQQQRQAEQVPSHPEYCQHRQNVPEALHHHQQHQQTFLPQNNKELIAQDRKSRVEPSSLLKERRYREVVKRQRQNNGLQDATAVKEAAEALRNPMNSKGLEYLANLDKKQTQIRLNGTQDPDESILQIWPHRPPDYALQQSKSEARANGLENERNPDNPRPPVPIFHGNEAMPMYPRRVERDQLFYSVHPPLGDNGIYQNCASALRNIGYPSQGYENHFQAHVNNQVQGGTSGNHQEVGPGRPSSLPFDMYSQQRQEHSQDILKSCLKGGQGDGSGHGQIKGQCYAREYFEEPRVIGGVKYIARKTEFIPNSHSPGQY